MGSNLIPQIYFKTTGYSFTHMGRLFLRLFVGLMVLQFGVRQLMGDPDIIEPTLLPLIASGLPTWLVIIVEIICPFLVMIGFLTRLVILPQFALAIVSSIKIFCTSFVSESYMSQMLCAPFLLMGIFMFLLLVGPGKISVDYFYSLYLINRNKGAEEDLEEV